MAMLNFFLKRMAKSFAAIRMAMLIQRVSSAGGGGRRELSVEKPMEQEPNQWPALVAVRKFVGAPFVDS